MEMYTVKPQRQKKSAWDRRQQRLRSEARCISRIVAGFASIDDHRGNQLSAAGRVLYRELAKGNRVDAAIQTAGLDVDADAVECAQKAEPACESSQPPPLQ
eukprot:6482318-Amphidinium_carterae.1